MEKMYLYFIAKMVSLVSCGAILVSQEREAGGLLIGLLAFCCLFLLQLLIGMARHGKYIKWTWIGMAVQTAACFWFGMGGLFPLLIFLALEWLDFLARGQMYYQIGLVGALLLGVLYTPSLTHALLTMGYAGLFFLARELNGAVLAGKERLFEAKERLAASEKKLEDMRAYAKTVRDTVALEERSRFAARIHDQLGHNISGSIILLEAALMRMEALPGEGLEETKQNLKAVAENLRGGVDEIRLALRQERPVKSRLGLAELKRQLEAFQTAYGVETRLEVWGDVEKTGAAVWLCIQDNLKETLTNMLKHSNGTRFRLELNGMNRVLRVEYADNGYSAGEPDWGMGLSAIEERTAACGGKCLVHGGSNGFTVTNIFLL